jgi:hypothetical protein
MLALGGTPQIPTPVAQLLLQMSDVFRDRLDTRSNPVEAFEPGCHFLDHCEESLIDAGTGQIELDLPSWPFRLIEMH